MNDDILKFLWIIPGWILVWFWNKVVPYKKNTNWSILGPVSIWSLAFYYAGFPIDEKWKLLFAVILSIVVGFIVIALHKFCIKKAIVRAFFDLFGYSSFPDKMSQHLYQLFGKDIILSTSLGKFYIGILRSASIKEGEKDRVLIINPSWSGYRQNNYSVVFDTSYISPNSKQKIEMMIPINSIISIGEFDKNLHKHFVETKKTKMIKSELKKGGINE